MSFFNHSPELSGTAEDAPRDHAAAVEVPASDNEGLESPTTVHLVPRHTGYAPADLGMTHNAASVGQHSGYAPTDATGPRAPASPSGGPGGMAGGSAYHSQGGGHHENGLHHSGWGPADVQSEEPPPDAAGFVGR